MSCVYVVGLTRRATGPRFAGSGGCPPGGQPRPVQSRHFQRATRVLPVGFSVIFPLQTLTTFENRWVLRLFTMYWPQKGTPI